MLLKVVHAANHDDPPANLRLAKSAVFDDGAISDCAKANRRLATLAEHGLGVEALGFEARA